METFKVPITQEMVTKALARALDLPEYTKNFKQHIQKVGDGEITAKVDGILGEMVAEIWLTHHQLAFTDARQFIEYDYLVEGLAKLEIKAKRRTVFVKPDYEATVPAYVHEVQQPHLYLFISHKLRKGRDDDFSRYEVSEVVGGIPRTEFDRKKREIPKGQFDDSNHWSCSEPCYNIHINEIYGQQYFAEAMKTQISKRKNTST